MSINAYEQMATGVTDITSIALVTLEVIHNALLINELRLRFACRELLGNLAARKHQLNTGLQLHTEIFQLCLHDISRLLVFKGYDNPSCFFNGTATTERYTLSLHDALPP